MEKLWGVYCKDFLDRTDCVTLEYTEVMSSPVAVMGQAGSWHQPCGRSWPRQEVGTLFNVNQ